MGGFIYLPSIEYKGIITLCQLSVRLYENQDLRDYQIGVNMCYYCMQAVSVNR